LPSYIEFLQHSEAYPHDAGEIILLQTHISNVLLAGAYVYKIKKPVDFGFLDFTSLAKRKFFCEEELRLNRRLCPDIYLEVVSIKSSEGVFYLGGDMGKTVEYAVKMRRLPEERMMPRLLSSGGLTLEMLDQIVETLVPFYQGAATGPEIIGFGSRDSVGENFRENFRQTEDFVDCPALSRGQYETIKTYVEGFLAAGEELFRERQETGRIHDCHGDLHSANICLADRVYIFDCIEFNRRLRYGDVAGDVAFLAMDLDFHGLPEMSICFIDRFVERSGDGTLYGVLNYYKCYRAYVRGKIGLLTAHAPEISEPKRRRALEEAGRYFNLAEGYAEAN
jgi:aminoglycoside phosphotransferase family enzyme